MKNFVITRRHQSQSSSRSLRRTIAYGQDIVKLDRFVQAQGQHRVDAVLSRRPRLHRSAKLAKSSRKIQRLHHRLSQRQRSRRRALLVRLRAAEAGPKGRSRSAAAALINRFPNSNWRSEAQALLVVLGRKADVEQALDRDNCEIKILALQSLFQADEERAIGIVTERSSHSSSPMSGLSGRGSINTWFAWRYRASVPISARHRAQQSRSETPSHRYQAPWRTTQRTSHGRTDQDLRRRSDQGGPHTDAARAGRKPHGAWHRESARDRARQRRQAAMRQVRNSLHRRAERCCFTRRVDPDLRRRQNKRDSFRDSARACRTRRAARAHEAVGNRAPG